MSIFTKIINGEIPCHKVYESDLVFAFLDSNPLSPGHTLVVPKAEKKFLHELDEKSAEALGKSLLIISKSIVTTLNCKNYNILQNNGSSAMQSVFHVHFHIIPKTECNNGLNISWNPSKFNMQQKIASEIYKNINE